jgi:hypothetical protein
MSAKPNTPPTEAELLDQMRQIAARIKANAIYMAATNPNAAETARLAAEAEELATQILAWKTN